MVNLEQFNDLISRDKFLLLSGFGVYVGVENGKLVVKDGEGQRQVYYPKRLPFDNLVLFHSRGSLTLDAIRFLIRHNVQITILNWNGRIITNLLPNEIQMVSLKFHQYRTYESPKRLLIAKSLIKAKIEKSEEVLHWLKERFGEIEFDIENEASKLEGVRTVPEILTIEGRIASIYWRELTKVFPKYYHFLTRQYTNRPFGAVDPINSLFNYGYALLESECRRSINSVGLDSHLGFLHEFGTGRESLVYDLLEPFRWLIDFTIIRSIENKVFSKKDFILTENYNIRLTPEAAKKLIKEVQNQLNKKVSYLGRDFNWSYIILLKTRELGQFLSSQRDSIDFSKPLVKLRRDDNVQLRKRILSMGYSEARKLGICKSELWYMKHNVMNGKPFKIYKKMQEKLNGEVNE